MKKTTLKRLAIISFVFVLLSACDSAPPPSTATKEKSVEKSQTLDNEKPEKPMPSQVEADTTQQVTAATQETTISPEPEPKSPVATPTPDTMASNDSPGTNQELIKLANKSGCLACHKIEKKLVGPAWQDVAAKYRGDAAAKSMLIEKVKKGGKGNWTEITGGTPMPPYSPRVSDDNIERLVSFILTLE